MKNRRMYLFPSEMGLLNIPNHNAKVSLLDSSCLQIKTINQMSIMAEGQIELKGKKVTLSTPREATLVRKDIFSPTVINLSNAFDAIGQKGKFTSNATEIKEKKKPLIMNRGTYSLSGVVAEILSNIPSDGEGDTVMEKIAGSIPVVTYIRGSNQEVPT